MQSVPLMKSAEAKRQSRGARRAPPLNHLRDDLIRAAIGQDCEVVFGILARTAAP